MTQREETTPDGSIHALLTGGMGKLPMILQAETSECGLACLAMVARFYGHRFEMIDFRRRVSTSTRGATLASLIQTAQALQLECRALKIDIDDLESLRLPCILHWDMNHFVVLQKRGRKRLVVHDPAIGVRRLTPQEFAKHFTGVTLEIWPSAGFKPVMMRTPVRLGALVGRLVGLKRGVLQVVGLAFALEIVAVLLPFQLQWSVDHALLAADHDLVTALSIGFLLLVLLQAGIAALRGWLITTLSIQMNFQWMGNVFAHLLRLPLAYFESRHLGTIQSYFGSIVHIQQKLTTGFTQALVDGVLVIGTLAMMFLYSLWLALLALFTVGLYAGVRFLLYRRLRDVTAEEILCDAKQHTHFLETVSGIQSVRLFGRESMRRMGWLNMLAEQYNARLVMERIGVAQHTANIVLFGVERVLVVGIAVRSVMRGDFSLGMLFAFMAYKEQFSFRTSSLIDKLMDLKMLRLHIERVADIVQATPERDDTGAGVNMDLVDASIELQEIRFRYASGDPEVLCGINLEIAGGECVAITGASGCGKTTLAKVLLGLCEPTAGRILVGRQPLQRIGFRDFRSIVGTVMQDDTLYTGSIADNISFFDPQAKEEDVMSSAQMAAIHDEILDMPMGYRTLIGDIGTGLSGGQKQRLLLARALYRRPRILLLDEATSHLDVVNERSINDTIRSLDLTRIIIAHRPETIAMAQRVVVLDQGQVVSDLRKS